jgi:CDP-diglyceride synthetase
LFLSLSLSRIFGLNDDTFVWFYFFSLFFFFIYIYISVGINEGRLWIWNYSFVLEVADIYAYETRPP